ncbi:MAG TPA: hypothetical protein VK066_07325 [Chloroflexota bacterium]|nr:hypothetical protein [Chloroflexota bacterium]
MAEVTLGEIIQWLVQRGQKDAMQIVRIRFDRPGYVTDAIAEDLKDQIISTDCPYGIVVITFDKFGMLESVEVT